MQHLLRDLHLLEAGNGGEYLTDIGALVGDAFHIGNDFQCRRDGAQIPRQRLLQGDQVHATLLDAFFHRVDLQIVRKNRARQSGVCLFQAADGSLHQAVHQPSHFSQVNPQPFQLLFKLCPRHMRSPPFFGRCFIRTGQ